MNVAQLLCARADDDHVGLRFDEEQWTWRAMVQASAERAALVRSLLDPDRPPHIAVVLANVPDYLFWLGAAALSGSTVVGINTTRRGQALAEDVRRTDCQLVVTDAAGAALVAGLDLGLSSERILRIDTGRLEVLLAPFRSTSPHQVAAESGVSDQDLFLLLFTSGTTGTPKAVRCTQGRLADIAVVAAGAYGYSADDVAYCAMPLFHGNALMVLWGPSMVVGATIALVRRFSASAFVGDVGRFGVTTFTYVGKALAYVLATPARPDDQALSLRRGFGTEASIADHAAFEERFGCTLIEGYGSSEGGAAINRIPGTPIGSLGKPTDDIVVVNAETLVECPPAEFETSGRMVNGDVAVGEIVNRSGIGRFEGYYGDPESTAARTRHGWYWTGDLAYRDAEGFFYFAGRRGDWLRVDSENLTAGPIERILVRSGDVAAVAVFGVPDVRSGDQVMAAVELLPGLSFDPESFAMFLAAQPDLGSKWLPSFIRVSESLPQTASGKVTKESLRHQGWWEGTDPVYIRVDAGAKDSLPRYRLLTIQDRDRLRAELTHHSRLDLLPPNPS